MANVLVIRSSATGANSVSNKLIDEILARIPDARIVERDIDRDPIPHITSASLSAIGRGEPQTEAEREGRALSDALVAEVQAADLLVIGAPMYNFGIPSTLKSWFDQVLRAGVTFRYTAEGPEGLLKGRKAIVVATRGGYYTEGPAAAMNMQEPHVRTLLGFVGITDVTFVRAEGLAVGPEQQAAGIAAAREAIANLDVPLPRAA